MYCKLLTVKNKYQIDIQVIKSKYQIDVQIKSKYQIDVHDVGWREEFIGGEKKGFRFGLSVGLNKVMGSLL